MSSHRFRSIAPALACVLTIGETPAFLRQGGIVRIYRDDNRLRLQISMKSAEGSRLQISSRLLSLSWRTR
jgi:hypothetical protein